MTIQPRSTRSNALYLYVAQGAGLVVPILIIPLLTRRLGPGSWGDVAALQAVGMVIGTLVEFGFIHSATRDIAMFRDDRVIAGQTYVAVQLLKGVLGSLVAVGMLALLALGQGEGASPRLWLSAVAFGVVQGLSLLWFFVGVEDVRTAALTELAGKVAAALVTVAAVRGPDDGWIFLAAQAAFGGVACVLNARRVRRYCDPTFPSMAILRRTATTGMHTFTWKILIALYTLGATPAVYAISGAREAAFFANGDKVSGALKSLVVPVSQAVYPRSVQFAESDLSRARSHLRRVLARVVFAYVVLAAACEAIAGWFVPWFFGADYASGEAAYRVLLLTMPVVAAANILSIQGPVARGEIRRFNLLILTTAMVWIGLALILTPRFGATGMAVACLLAESLKLALLAPELWRTEPVGLTGASRRAEAEE